MYTLLAEKIATDLPYLSSFTFFLSLSLLFPSLSLSCICYWGRGGKGLSTPDPHVVGGKIATDIPLLFFFLPLFFPSLYLLFSFFLSLSFLLSYFVDGGGGEEATAWEARPFRPHPRSPSSPSFLLPFLSFPFSPLSLSLLFLLSLSLSLFFGGGGGGGGQGPLGPPGSAPGGGATPPPPTGQDIGGKIALLSGK